jgi:hypothetical protein
MLREMAHGTQQASGCATRNTRWTLGRNEVVVSSAFISRSVQLHSLPDLAAIALGRQHLRQWNWMRYVGLELHSTEAGPWGTQIITRLAGWR